MCLSGFDVVFALSQLISGFCFFIVPVVFCDYVPSCLYSSTTEVYVSFIFQLQAS